MATGLNMFSVVEELSSPAFRKIAALMSPKRGYPELPDLSDNPRPSYTTKVTQQFRWLSTPLTVTFTCASHEPAGNNGCGSLPQKGWGPMAYIILLQCLLYRKFNLEFIVSDMGSIALHTTRHASS